MAEIRSGRTENRTVQRLSRRKMLATVGSTTAGYLLVSAGTRGTQPKTLGPGDVTKALLDPLVGTTFTAQNATTSVALTLVKVEGRAEYTQKFKIPRQPVTVTFSARLGARPADGIYSLTHPAVNRIAGVFLSPIGRPSAAKGSQYQAVFS
jgi:hypothetical protein